jgi:D-alanyl-D-alanine carboxypeptidase
MPSIRRSLAAALAVALPLTTGPALAAQPAAEPAAERPQPTAAAKVDGPQLQRQLKRVLTKGGGVGVVAEVATPDGRWRSSAGVARTKPRTPASPSARFRAASVTKSVVSVLALQLVANGRWTLDTTIGDVLPKLWPERSDITLRQLLSHSSGMPEMVVPLLAEATTTRKFLREIRKKRTDRELVRAAKTAEWLFEPGTDMKYSNTNYVVVGMMLRRATGKSVAQLAERRVFAPARMGQSKLARSKRVKAPRLHEYGRFDGRLVDLRGFSPTIFSSSGSMVSTTRDLNRFHRALSTGALLPKRLVREMRSVVAVDQDTGAEYGLGSYRLPDPCRPGGFLHGHDGATYGTVTLTFSSPDGRRRVTVASTGRTVTLESPPLMQLMEFVFLAAEQSCPGAPAAAKRLDLAKQLPLAGRSAQLPFSG